MQSRRFFIRCNEKVATQGAQPSSVALQGATSGRGVKTIGRLPYVRSVIQTLSGLTVLAAVVLEVDVNSREPLLACGRLVAVDDASSY
jgi:hypothetical protein